jgi:hypothetical protein
MSDEQTEPIETMTEETSEPVVASAGNNDDELRNFGAGIALCAVLVLFVSSSFAIWNLELESKSDFGTIEGDYTFNVNELNIEIGEMENDFKYDDSECDCGDLESFFGNLKILLYILLISGVAMAYIGHTGEKTEFTEKIIAAAALFSVIILAYTFISLPGAFNEDMEMDDIEAKFIGTSSDSEEGVDNELKGSPGMGYLVLIVPLGLTGYLIKTRGITLEDIKG